MMKKNLLILAFVLLYIISFGQSPIAKTGTRTTLGLFGGGANDLAFSSVGDRLFAAVKGPGTLYYSDSYSHDWIPVFPIDSMSYVNQNRGWGGGSKRVITNNSSFVLIHTLGVNGNTSEAVVSFDNGDTWTTAMNADMLHTIANQYRTVSAIELVDSTLFIAMEEILLRRYHTPVDTTEVIPVAIPAGYSIASVAASNNQSGYPLYMVLIASPTDAVIAKFDGTNLFILPEPNDPDFIPVNIFTHHGETNGKTVLYSYKDINTNKFYVKYSIDEGVSWADISPSPMDFPLHDADFFPSWTSQMPVSQGLRISFPNGILSDDLGATWQSPSVPIIRGGIASSPQNTDQIIASGKHFVLRSQSGINGPFERLENIGFHNFSVYDIDNKQGKMYMATSCGLAFTEKYDQGVPEELLWTAPNGQFPIPSLPEGSVTSVCMNPNNTKHVVCGGPFGFAVKFAGNPDFIITTPADWNSGPNIDYTVTDIEFVNNGRIIATTGKKFIKTKDYIAPNIGNIWISDDGGNSWSKNVSIPPGDFISGNTILYNYATNIIMIGSGANEAELTGNGALWISSDNGDTWTQSNTPISTITGNNLPVYDIEQGASPDDYYFAAGEKLLFSNDGFGFVQYTLPSNIGAATALLFENNYDTLKIAIGNSIADYLLTINDVDISFEAYPDEHFYCLAHGSLLAGSTYGSSKTTSATAYSLDLKIFYEGPFNTSTLEMDTTLNTLGYLPLNQPFNVFPWYYSGTESVSSIPNTEIVDWILVELRATTGDASSATKDKAFKRQAGFILKDGSIVGLDGSTPLRFSRIIGSKYTGIKDSQSVHAKLIVKRHTKGRTNSPLVIDPTAKTATYDYTLSASRYYDGTSVAKELSSGIWGLLTGDANEDGYINNVDKNDYWVPKNGNSGYYPADFNMNGTVDSTDLDDYWKVNTGLGTGEL
jgi:hypothetical protein